MDLHKGKVPCISAHFTDKECEVNICPESPFLHVAKAICGPLHLLSGLFSLYPPGFAA